MKVNTISIMEDIIKGENIRKYSVEAWINNKWESVYEGISVGHKRIQNFNPVQTDKLRLKILTADQTPLIKDFAAYDIEEN